MTHEDGIIASVSPEVVASVRHSVRNVLEETPAFAHIDKNQQRLLAHKLVGLGVLAAGLIDQDQRLTERVAERRHQRGLASALSAGDQLGLQGVRGAAPALTQARDSIDFPNFVGSLITGVFNAILHSSSVQMGQLGELVDGVATSADDFAKSISDAEVAQWLIAKFPRLLRVTEDGVDAVEGVDLSEHTPELASGLGASSGEDPTDPYTLMDLGRRKLARDKQSTLASMIQLGLQRIVVDQGRIHASMDLRVDAQSGSAEARAQRDDWRVNAGAQGSFTNGLWGASASASTSIGQVKSDAQLTNEQLGLRAGLRSSVDLAFRTDQVPIDKLASRNARVKLEQAARVPADVTSGGSLLAPAPSNFSAPSLDVPPTAPATPPPARPTGAQGNQGQTPTRTQPAGSPPGTAQPQPAGSAGSGTAAQPQPGGTAGSGTTAQPQPGAPLPGAAPAQPGSANLNATPAGPGPAGSAGAAPATGTAVAHPPPALQQH